MRVGEIATLQWEHIIETPTTYAPGVINLKQAKDGGRTVRMGSSSTRRSPRSGMGPLSTQVSLPSFEI